MATGVSRATEYLLRSTRVGSQRPAVRGTRLQGHIPQSETTIHGRSAILLGLPFLAIGIFIGLMAIGVVSMGRSSDRYPQWFVASFGGIFGVPGLWMILHGVRGMVRLRAARRLTGVERWRSDYCWKETGITDQQARGVEQMFFMTLFVALFATPFNFIAYAGSREGSSFGYLFTCVDLFVAVFSAVLVYRVIRWIKYGTGRIRFERFPYFLGDRARLAYVPGTRLDGFEKLECTLRCIREAYETRGWGSEKRQEVVCYELCSQSITLGASQLCTSFDRAIDLEFALPAGAEPTRLLERPATYWEVEVCGKSRGVDLNSRFLLPIYDRPGRK
ncbi:MAG TPA: hypothetical protein VMV81_08140 [Phycisphaerae bacterium]|nr:hypothetical protein [Phycisphaerae bacterium]